jgi:hypothetical protein
MRKMSPRLFFVLLLFALRPSAANAQSANGTLAFTARITPTAARPEPVRQFTFYLLTKSYADVVKEVEEQSATPSRDKFIDDLKLSPELKTWLKGHDVFDLTTPGFDRLLTPDDIIGVSEFLLAYQRSNSGGVTQGIPRPKYRDVDSTENPDRYNKQVQEYHAALKKFIQARPETVSGIELELEGINPQRKWQQLQAEHKKRVLYLAPSVAQTKYLAGKLDTDLDGSGSLSGLPPGNYWLSTLNLDANAGDMRLAWDVPVTISPGQTVRIELTNLNAVDRHFSGH